MDQTTLVNDQIAAGLKLVHEFNKFSPVLAACWIRLAGEEKSYLYLAAEKVDDLNFAVGHEELMRLVDEIDDPSLIRFRVKLIGAGHPYARAASEIHRLHPKWDHTRLTDQFFGGAWIEEAYVYLPPVLEAVS